MGKKKALLIVVLILAVVLTAGVLMAINGRRLAVATIPKSQPRAAAAHFDAQPASATDLNNVGFASAASYDKMAKENAGVVAAVPDYKLKPDLSNVVNLKQFRGLLEPALIQAIAKNKFAVTPTDYIQMFHLYENNMYQRPELIPSFITTDSMLHTYHVFYDYSLREVEVYKLLGALEKLTDAMLKASEDDYAAAVDPIVKDAARRNVAYFAVARTLLSGKPAPKDVQGMVEADLAQISAHGGKAESEILGTVMNFSQFVPRGHYTRSEALKKYFMAMMWYGLAPFDVRGKSSELNMTQALLIVRNLRTVSAGKDSALKLWDMIYEPTVFYVGKADDYSYCEVVGLVKSVYGANPSVAAFADKAKLQQFVDMVAKLPGPKIAAGGQGRQFRFMGQRFIPDSRVTQEVSKCVMPSGLDVMASMGSDRAFAIRKQSAEIIANPDYLKAMAKMQGEMKATSRSKWQSNLYYGWLWSLQSINAPAPAGYPAFMRNQAWIDKSLLTALGSWTELRHDTILYAKQSSTECGGEGAEKEPPTPKGYVEPNLEFWTRLKWLNDYTLQGLSSRGLLSAELKDKFSKLDDWLTFCRNITIKELTGKKLTKEEYDQISMYGPDLEQLTLQFAGGEVTSTTDNDMAIVADVHTHFGLCLEEGTGRAGAIYVVVPIEGKLYLTRGASYMHYEFTWPAGDRLTDEAWQKQLNSGKQPALADWTKSFFIKTKKKPEMEFGISTGGGC